MPAIRPNESGLLEVKFKNTSGDFTFTGLTVVTNFSKIFLNGDSKIFDHCKKIIVKTMISIVKLFSVFSDQVYEIKTVFGIPIHTGDEELEGCSN